jgi:ribosomal protein S18 acetylase RimI-like enzyme
MTRMTIGLRTATFPGRNQRSVCLVRILEATTVEQVEAAAPLYDGPPVRGATTAFVADPRHHLLVALDEDGRTVGFVSGVETTHPDKGTEMFLYELAVAEDSRRRGIGKALTASLADLARSRGCYGMWVGVDTDNEVALATYRAAGGNEPEPCVLVTWTF